MITALRKLLLFGRKPVFCFFYLFSFSFLIRWKQRILICYKSFRNPACFFLFLFDRYGACFGPDKQRNELSYAVPVFLPEIITTIRYKPKNDEGQIYWHIEV